MKIEKINNNQIKLVLTPDDLKERNIKLTELAYGSEKTQELFREIMNQAMEECGFYAEDMPLMIEATPLSTDSIMIIVTKVTEGLDLESKFNLTPNSKTINKFKNKAPVLETSASDNISIFSFASLDDVSLAALRLSGYFTGQSFLVKNHNRYFLVLHGQKDNANLTSNELEAVLYEYGQKHVSTVISQYHLKEHGEMLIQNDAVEILANM